jgi:hypothetical protein
VRRAAAAITCNPHLARAFEGGVAEVSVFWVEDGVPLKAGRYGRFRNMRTGRSSNFTMFHDLADDHLVAQALAIEQLSSEWKRRVEVMRGRLRRGEPLSSNLIDL